MSDAIVSIQHFRNLIAARTDALGNPKEGYKTNVALLRRELAHLESKAPSGSEGDVG